MNAGVTARTHPGGHSSLALSKPTSDAEWVRMLGRQPPTHVSGWGG